MQGTYARFDATGDLEQGDIIRLSGEMKSVLKEHHGHFTNDKYVGFIIATQTCDLVRRQGASPKSPYITIAVIRPLANISKKLLNQTLNPIHENIYRKSEKFQASGLFERIYNQNEQALGLFFLHENADSGIAEPCVAMLRVTVAVKSEHYEQLIVSRVGRINEEFRAKLGWLIGNLFARPATRDWSELEGNSEKLKDVIAPYLMKTGDNKDITWVEDGIIKLAESKSIEINDLTLADLKSLRPSSSKDRVLEIISETLNKIINPSDSRAPDNLPGVSVERKNELLSKIVNRLKNNKKLSQVFKELE